MASDPLKINLSPETAALLEKASVQLATGLSGDDLNAAVLKLKLQGLTAEYNELVQLNRQLAAQLQEVVERHNSLAEQNHQLVLQLNDLMKKKIPELVLQLQQKNKQLEKTENNLKDVIGRLKQTQGMLSALNERHLEMTGEDWLNRKLKPVDTKPKESKKDFPRNDSGEHAGNRGEMNPRDAAFCERCGAKLSPQAAFCGKCGTPKRKDDEDEEKGDRDSSPSHGSMSVHSDVYFPRDNSVPMDQVREELTIFTKHGWESRWEKLARSSRNELGIILTDVQALANQLNVSTAEIENLIGRHIASSRKRGVEYCLLRLENNAVSSGAKQVGDIVALLRRIAGVAFPKFLFILGNETIVDVVTWPNESRSGDVDVDSDFAYSVLDMTSPWERQDFALSHALRVGRLPTSKGDFQGFQAYILNAEKNIGAVDDLHPFGLSAKVWEKESQYELEHFRTAPGMKVFTSPNTNLGIMDSLKSLSRFLRSELNIQDPANGKPTSPPNLLYFNLHGSDRTPFWYGQNRKKEYPEAISPDTFKDYSAPFFLGTEACFGARYIGLNRDESIVKTALSNKCLAFLGSSRIAWGSPSGPEHRSSADIVVGDFMKHVACGETAGDAHILGLESLIRKTKTRDTLVPEEIVTIVEFSLYGDPSACTGMNRNRISPAMSMANTMAASPWGDTSKGIGFSMSDIKKTAKLSLSEFQSDMIARIDDFVAKYYFHGEEIVRNANRIRERIYQLQGTGLFRKSYAVQSKLGESYVSVYFDRNGNVCETFVSR